MSTINLGFTRPRQIASRFALITSTHSTLRSLRREPVM